MKPKPPPKTLDDVIAQFNGQWAPWIRCTMFPAMLATLAAQDFDELWFQLESKIKDDLLARERARDTLAMVERWARESVDLAERHRSERASQDSMVEPSKDLKEPA